MRSSTLQGISTSARSLLLLFWGEGLLFDAYTQPDNVLGHVSFRSCLCINAGMAHAAGWPSVLCDMVGGGAYQGMDIRLLTQPKLTLMAHSLVLSTILSLTAMLPVSKLSTAPAPRAMLQCRSYCGCDFRPG